MLRATTMLAVVGCFVAAGIALSFYGSMIIVEDIAQGTENIGNGESMEIRAELDPAAGQKGIFAVQVIDRPDAMITVTVTNPSGGLIWRGPADSGALEEYFDVVEAGTFTLGMTNPGEPADVAGAIGHAPDSSKLAVGATGLYLLIAGLIGMGAVGVYAVKNR